MSIDADVGRTSVQASATMMRTLVIERAVELVCLHGELYLP